MLANVQLIHALPPAARRCFDRKEAASYVGVSPTHFDKLVRKGLMPLPHAFLGRKVWDIRVLNHYLDQLSGFSAVEREKRPVGEDEELDRELAAFEAKHGHH